MARQYCEICESRYAECKHHLIFGNANRRICDADNICLNLCNECHNLSVKASDRIHGNSVAERLSKMLGQALWMLDQVSDEKAKEDLKEAFRKRYGRSYL